MALNPFEQLQLVHAEPRQAFEDAVADILRAVFPGNRRVRVHQGDGGVDVFNGTYGEEGAIEVYQIKYFPGVFDDSRKRQIRESYATALNSPDYKLKKWILCVPMRLTKDDLRWFDEWGGKQDVAIELIDGDDLTDLLRKDECASIRQQLGEWGVAGMKPGGARFAAAVIPQRLQRTNELVLVVQLKNAGDRTAQNVKAELSHGETYCGAMSPDPSVWNNEAPGFVNPWKLRCANSINPEEGTVIVGVPVSSASTWPMQISLKVWAADTPASELFCSIPFEQAEAGEPVPFAQGKTSVSNQIQNPRRPQPSHEGAKIILELILQNPKLEERGLTQMLNGISSMPLTTVFIASASGRGEAKGLQKPVFRQGIAELLQLGWLLDPEESGSTLVYAFNPDCSQEGK